MIRSSGGRRSLVSSVAILMIILVSATSCIDISYPAKETYWENTTVSENHTETYSQVVPVISTVSGEQTLTPYIVWSNSQLEFNSLKHFWYYGYSLPKHDDYRVKILFLKQSYYEFVRVYVFDFEERGQILPPPTISTAENVSTSAAQLQGISSWNNWINSADTKLTLARPLASISDLWLNYYGNRVLEFDTHGSREIAIIMSGPSIAQNCYFTTTLSWSDYTTENVTKSSERIVSSSTQQPIPKTRSTSQTKQVPFWEIPFNW